MTGGKCSSQAGTQLEITGAIGGEKL